MTSSDVFASSPADLEEAASSLAAMALSASDALFREETSGFDDFCTVDDGVLLISVGVDVTGVFSLAVTEVVEPEVEVPVVGTAWGLPVSGSFVFSGVTGGPGFFCANLFRILLSVMCNRAETGGRLIKVDGKRVTSFFMSESNSSN